MDPNFDPVVEEIEIEGMGVVITDPMDAGNYISGDLGRFPKSRARSLMKRTRGRKRLSSTNIGRSWRSKLSRSGLSPVQKQEADLIWGTIFSQVTLGTGTDSQFKYFTGSPTNLEDGNVANGTLPSPQTMTVKRVSFGAAGISAAGLLHTDYAALLNAVLSISVADKKYLEVPLMVVGINAMIIAGTVANALVPNGPPLYYTLPVPIIIPENSRFNVVLTTGDKALSGSVESTVALTGEINRLVN